MVADLIALDPGLNCTGWAVFHRKKLIASGCVRSKGEDVCQKLLSLHTKLSDILTEFNPAEAAIELPPSFTFTRSKAKETNTDMNQGSLHKLNRAYGALALTCMLRDIRVIEVPMVVWKGNRAKANDTDMARLIAGRKVTSDEGDAVMLGHFVCSGSRALLQEACSSVAGRRKSSWGRGAICRKKAC